MADASRLSLAPEEPCRGMAMGRQRRRQRRLWPPAAAYDPPVPNEWSRALKLEEFFFGALQQHLQELRQKSGAPGAGAATASRRAKTPPALSQLREREREHLVLQSLERLEHKHTAERAVRDLTEVIENASLEELRKFLRVAFDSKRPLVASKARQQLLLLLRSVVRRFHALNAGSDATKALKAGIFHGDLVMARHWFPNCNGSPSFTAAVSFFQAPRLSCRGCVFPGHMIFLAIGFVLLLLLVPCLWLLIITFFPAKTDSIAGKNCAVTGASEGLGAVLALHLAQVGVNKLLLGARRMEKLEKVKADVLKQVPKAEVILVKLDVRESWNAFFEKMTDDHVDQMLETNLSCCVKLTRDFVKFMLEASGGHVVNVASVAGQLPVPFGAVYATSKAGLRNFSASLRAEMIYEKKPISVHSVSPGLVVDAGLAADREERLGRTLRFPFAVMFLFPRAFENVNYLASLIGMNSFVKYFRKDAEFEAANSKASPLLVHALKSAELTGVVVTTLHDILDCHVPEEDPQVAKEGFLQAGKAILQALMDPLALGMGWDSEVKRRCVSTLAAITPELLRRARQCHLALEKRVWDEERRPGAGYRPLGVWAELLETYARLLVHCLEVSSDLHEGLLQCLLQLSLEASSGLIPFARQLAALCAGHLLETPSTPPAYLQVKEMHRPESPPPKRALSRDLALACCDLLQRLAPLQAPDAAGEKIQWPQLRSQVLQALDRENLTLWNLQRLTRGHEKIRKSIKDARQAWDALPESWPSGNAADAEEQLPKTRNRAMQSVLEMRQMEQMEADALAASTTGRNYTVRWLRLRPRRDSGAPDDGLALEEIPRRATSSSWYLQELAAMEVCFLTSGETLTVLDDELQGQTAKAVKKALAAKVGISRFKQIFFVEDGSREIQDDEVLDPSPLKIQLVVLEFWPPDDEETQKVISASWHNDLLALEHLLQQPRNPNEADTDGKTPLFHAAEQGHIQPMELLLEAGAKTDEREFARGGTPMLFAALNGHLDIVGFLVEHGAAKDQADSDGATPLLVAALNDHLDIVEFLVKHGAAKDQSDNNGATPLLVAAVSGHLDIVEFLVEHGAAKDQADNHAQRGHLDTVCFLVEHGAAKDQADNHGATALLLAAQTGNLETVRFLVKSGAAKNQPANNGVTVLLVAALNDHLDIVRFLVESGAAKDQAANNGATALLLAAQCGHLDIVCFLVEHGAAKDQADNNGATPLLLAAQYGHLDIVEFLVEHGAAKDQADNNGATPLLLAAQNVHPDIEGFLLEAGAGRDQPEPGHSPGE
eukprot:s911_g11.t1